MVYFQANGRFLSDIFFWRGGINVSIIFSINVLFLNISHLCSTVKDLITLYIGLNKIKFNSGTVLRIGHYLSMIYTLWSGHFPNFTMNRILTEVLRHCALILKT